MTLRSKIDQFVARLMVGKETLNRRTTVDEKFKCTLAEQKAVTAELARQVDEVCQASAIRTGRTQEIPPVVVPH